LPAEIALVIETARLGDYQVQGYDGVTRARIYLLSYMTGLRKGEIASLTPASFKLDAEQPVVTVAARASKRRRKDTLPLHADLVGEVRQWVDGLADDEPLFPLLGKRKAYAMIQRDLEEAGIPYETEEGLADFHAAGRHTHITGLLKSGVSLVAAKELARHSDVRMTMRYTHIGLADQAAAVNRLPALPPSQSGPEKCLHIVCTSSGAARQSASSSVIDRQRQRSDRKRKNPRRSKGLDASWQPLSPIGNACQKVEAAGIEPCDDFVVTGEADCSCENCQDCRAAYALHSTCFGLHSLASLGIDLPARTTAGARGGVEAATSRQTVAEYGVNDPVLAWIIATWPSLSSTMRTKMARTAGCEPSFRVALGSLIDGSLAIAVDLDDS
jgi:hypothetical protein